MNRVSGLLPIVLCSGVLSLSRSFAWDAFNVVATDLSAAVAGRGAISMLGAEACVTVILCGAAAV